MFVTRISIQREGYYGSYGAAPKATSAFNATIELHGQRGKVELNLAPEMSAKIVELIADEVAAAGRATAEAMTASILEPEPMKKALPNKAAA